jgi:hypothetical protein
VLPPVLHRELLVRARRGSTNWIRLGITSFAFVLVCTLYLFSSLVGFAQTGRYVFQPLFYLLLVYALFEGTRAVATSIPDERNDGTLGFLFLTELSGWDVLTGKLAGGAITAFYGVMAVTPVFALPALMGGVTGGEVLRALVVLVTGLVLALACGALAAAWCRTALTALMTALGLVITFVTLPALASALLPLAFPATGDLAWTGWLSPFVSAGMTTDLVFSRDPFSFWWSLLAQWLAAGALMILASVRLNRNWRDGAVLASASSRIGKQLRNRLPSHGIWGKTFVLPRFLSPFSATPLARNLSRRLNLGRWMGLLVAMHLLTSLPGWVAHWIGATNTTMVVQAALGLPSMLLYLGGKLVLIYLACRVFSEARNTGEMEILLTSPIGDRELVTTLWKVLRRGLWWILLIHIINQCLALQTVQTFGVPQDALWARLISALLNILAEWFSMVGVVWAGMWFGVQTTRTASAVVKTLALVVIATGLCKWLLFALSTFAMNWIFSSVLKAGGFGFMSFYTGLPALISLVLSLAWLVWARRNLFTRFRTVVTQTEYRSLWKDRLAATFSRRPPPLPTAQN